MATDQNNNIFINEFKGGMNSDTSYDSLQNNQYIFGKNIRITNNTLLNKAEDSNSKEGILCPIDSGEIVNDYGIPQNGVRILATASIDNIGAIIVKDSDEFWHIYRVKEGKFQPIKIFSSDVTTKKEKFSVVINKELGDSVKLYIADGEHQMMCIDIDPSNDKYNLNLTSVYDLISNNYFPQNKVIIQEKINGQLPACQLQYAYRLYKKNGIKSKMSPLTHKIQVIDSNRNKEEGNAEGTITTVGFKLNIPIDENEKRLFTHIQIYRLVYQKMHEDSSIHLIYDSSIKDDVTINDDGLNPIQQLSVDEFSALNGMDIVPDSIEQNQNYMFAANIKDETVLRIEDNEYDSKAYQYTKDGVIMLFNQNDTQYTNPRIFNTAEDVEEGFTLNKYSDVNYESQIVDIAIGMFDKDNFLGGTGNNISWRFIKTYVPLHEFTSNGQEPPYTSIDGNESRVYYIKYDGSDYIDYDSGLDVKDILEQSGIYCKDKFSYDSIITSSMFRSLKRDEVYRYGIVFYDEHGRRSQTKWIADIRVPDFIETTKITEGCLFAAPIGIQFDVKSMPKGAVSYQIVRCSKEDQYTKNILQCVIARPIRQELPSLAESIKYSPYYPHYILNSNPYNIQLTKNLLNFFDTSKDEVYNIESMYNESYTKTDPQVQTYVDIEDDMTTIQIFSPYITYRRNDCLSLLKSSTSKIKQLYHCYRQNNFNDGFDIYCKKILNYTIFYRAIHSAIIDGVNVKRNFDGSNYIDFGEKVDKTDASFVYRYYNNTKCNVNTITNIKGVADVSNPNWEDGYSNHQLSGESLSNATKQYKSYTTNVSNIEYVNWVCNGMYDIPATSNNDQAGYAGDSYALYSRANGIRPWNSYGLIGPGPVCFIAKVENTSSPMFWCKDENIKASATVCNISHVATQFGGLKDHDKQYDTYYGFGNFKKYNSEDTKISVFDGDTYITPFEIVSMFKAYDFNSIDTLQSAQFIYYVPLESSINTFFDYGMNYRNTQNKSLQLEPGEITGITSQDRPLCQYNMIYTDNNVSNDVFGSQDEEEDITTIPQRICYSQLKNPGERIDSWSYFLPIDYIDADARHGEITHIMTSKDILYFWQKQAFGRLSVNERSLITDNNSNQIQLGQGGVVQRTDYIDTRHGMRKYDRSSTIAEGQVYWIDIINKAIVATNGQQVQNISEQFNVQNIVNERMSNDIPNIHYDQQNNELVCKCLGDDQMVFNIKLGAATSVYERRYDDVILFNNVIYGLTSKVKMTKYNYLDERDGRIFMPTEVKFIINPASSTTKVFDNQEIILLNKQGDKFLKGKQFTFSTNIMDENQINPEGYTDREGNVRYAIPRESNVEYGSRIRGKWLKVGIQDNTPDYNSSISHIITKFRQSFS